MLVLFLAVGVPSERDLPFGGVGLGGLCKHHHSPCIIQSTGTPLSASSRKVTEQIWGVPTTTLRLPGEAVRDRIGIEFEGLLTWSGDISRATRPVTMKYHSHNTLFCLALRGRSMRPNYTSENIRLLPTSKEAKMQRCKEAKSTGDISRLGSLTPNTLSV